MREIINIQHEEGKFLVSSREISTNFEKEHKNIIRAIEVLIDGCAQKSADLFVESKYQHNQNKQWYKEYLMTRDGFSLLVMGFTGDKALNWKLKYIEAFNKMEQELKNQNTPKSLEDILIIQLNEMKAVKEQVNQVNYRALSTQYELEDFRDNAPLFNSECDELIKVVRRVATKVLGGYRSNGYKDKSVRAKVYRDIQQQIKRQFGVESYKAIKRCQLEKALELVEEYQVPFVLEDEIEVLNNQLALA